MSFWIFKVSDQRLYADQEGVRYEYDNRHSVRVRMGDRFTYLDKRANGYRFTGVGTVLRLDEREPTREERRRSGAVRTIFTAWLGEVQWFEPPLDISPTSSAGRWNREMLGIPSDVNAKGWGWSISMPSIAEHQFHGILAAGVNGDAEVSPVPPVPAPSWAPPEGIFDLRPQSALIRQLPGYPRRARDPGLVGERAEQIVYDFLAGGELEKLGGAGLRWRARDGEQPGWDLDYKDTEGRLNAIEVKGTAAVRFSSIEITENEWRAAGELRDKHWLFLVADCWSHRPKIQRIRDSFGLSEQGGISAVPSVWRLARIGSPEKCS